jgi:protein-disulfide isomerase
MNAARRRRHATQLAAATVALLATSLAGPAYAQQTPPAQPQSAQARLLERASQQRATGSEAAPVLVYEISDLQCPYCRQFALEVFPHIDSAYIRTNRVQWVFVSLPMPSHPNAWIAHEAAACAAAVSDRFWPMKERIFRDQAEWAGAADPGALMTRYARAVGVPMDAWSECVQQDRVAALILQDVLFASRVTGTPTFIVNNQQTVVGVKSFSEWRDILDAALRPRR